METEQQPASDPIRFRASKKRKAYRQRSATEDDDSSSGVIPRASSPPDVVDLDRGIASAAAENPDGETSDADNAVAAALRLRNSRRAGRFRGVGFGFRSEGRSGDNDDGEQHQALILREADGAVAAGPERDGVVGGITSRFMHQTGLLTHVDDRHMNAYIESRLASRNGPSGTSTNPPADATDTNSTTAAAATPGPSGKDSLRDQPTKQGKLVEVDIPSDILDKNHENKRRRMEKSNKPPRRHRNRRNSDDIARDNLVEQFLHENRLDVYDVPSSSETPTASAPGGDPSADDRLAEQFRQQYLDEQALRRKKKRPVQQQQQRQQTGDVLKGPKLGGSRNVRAAVRDILLQQEKDKKGK